MWPQLLTPVSLSFLFQVPPLTPGTDKSFGEALKMTFSAWNQFASDQGISEDPRYWSVGQVRAWLRWTREEFSLGADLYADFVENFQVKKRRQMKDSFVYPRQESGFPLLKGCSIFGHRGTEEEETE